MAKKTVEQEPEVAIAESNSESAAQERIKELEAKIRESEEKTLARVCKAMGVDPKEIEAKESKKTKESLIRMWVQHPVRVNMNVYQGDVTVPISTARVIQQALGDRRMRLLRELTGNNYILKEIQGIGFIPQIVGQVDIAGEPTGPEAA